MKELDTLVENYFTPAFGATDILRLVEQIMDETPMIVSEAQEDIDVRKDMSIDDLLGSLSINPKAWGNPEQTDGDRAVVASYAASLGLSNSNDPEELFRTLGESFKQLQEAPESEENKCSLMKSLSIIQILNTMSRVMSDIGNASASGFVMEAFLSALFPNGKWESDASGIGLADFIIQGGETDHLISLKTIKEDGMIEGSKNNLLYDLFGSDTRSGGVVTYYILAKPSDGSALHVKKFDITPKNVSDLTGITEEQILLWRERHDAATLLKPEIDELKAKKEAAKAAITDVWRKLNDNSDETITPLDWHHSRKDHQTWLAKKLREMGVNFAPEQVEAFAQKYDEYGVVHRELNVKLPAYEDVSKRWLKDKWGGDTTFYVGQEKAELVATLNIDPKALYETANKSLRSIVDQLVQIQQDYRDTVREMHSYLSTLSNTSASGFKKEVAEFDQSVQTNVKGNERCEPDFVK
jgi:hypothetical protein